MALPFPPTATSVILSIVSFSILLLPQSLNLLQTCYHLWLLVMYKPQWAARLYVILLLTVCSTPESELVVG